MEDFSVNDNEIRNDFSGDDFQADNYTQPDVTILQSDANVTRVTRTGSETEVRQVDPTKNKKLQKRQQEAKNKVTKKEFKLPKWALVVGSVALLVIVVIVAKAIMSANKSKDTNFFTVFDTVTQPTQPGLFHYDITVATQPNMKVIDVVENEVSMETVDDLNNMEIVEQEELGISEFANEKTGSNYIFKEWTNIDGTKVTSWQYPTFQIIIDELCTSTDPFEASFKIQLATTVTNAEFTEIIVKDGKYYIDLDTMRNWLITSKDSYLMSVAQEIPEGIKYVEITEDDLNYYYDHALVSKAREYDKWYTQFRDNIPSYHDDVIYYTVHVNQELKILFGDGYQKDNKYLLNF